MWKIICLFSLFARTLSAPSGCIETCSSLNANSQRSGRMSSCCGMQMASPTNPEKNWTTHKDFLTDDGAQVHHEEGQYTDGRSVGHFKKTDYFKQTVNGASQKLEDFGTSHGTIDTMGSSILAELQRQMQQTRRRLEELRGFDGHIQSETCEYPCVPQDVDSGTVANVDSSTQIHDVEQKFREMRERFERIQGEIVSSGGYHQKTVVSSGNVEHEKIQQKPARTVYYPGTIKEQYSADYKAEPTGPYIHVNALPGQQTKLSVGSQVNAQEQSPQKITITSENYESGYGSSAGQGYQQGHGSTGQSQQNYGTTGKIHQGYGAREQTHQAYGTTGQSHQDYGITGQSHQTYERPAQTQQSYTSIEQSHQSYGTTGQIPKDFVSTGQSHQSYGTGQIPKDFVSTGQSHQSYGTGQIHQGYESTDQSHQGYKTAAQIRQNYGSTAQLNQGYRSPGQNRPGYDATGQIDRSYQESAGQNQQQVQGSSTSFSYGSAQQNQQPIYGSGVKSQRGYGSAGQIYHQGYGSAPRQGSSATHTNEFGSLSGNLVHGVITMGPTVDCNDETSHAEYRRNKRHDSHPYAEQVEDLTQQAHDPFEETQQHSDLHQLPRQDFQRFQKPRFQGSSQESRDFAQQRQLHFSEQSQFDKNFPRSGKLETEQLHDFGEPARVQKVSQQEIEALGQEVEDIRHGKFDIGQQVQNFDLTQQSEDLTQQSQDFSQQLGFEDQNRRIDDYSQHVGKLEFGQQKQKRPSETESLSQTGKFEFGHQVQKVSPPEKEDMSQQSQDLTQQFRPSDDFSQQIGRLEFGQQKEKNPSKIEKLSQHSQDFTQQTSRFDDFPQESGQFEFGHQVQKVSSSEIEDMSQQNQDLTQQTIRSDAFSQQIGRLEFGKQKQKNPSEIESLSEHNRDFAQQISRFHDFPYQNGKLNVGQQLEKVNPSELENMSQQTQHFTQQTQFPQQNREFADFSQHSGKLEFGQQTQKVNPMEIESLSQQTEDGLHQLHSQDYTQQARRFDQQTVGNFNLDQSARDLHDFNQFPTPVLAPDTYQSSNRRFEGQLQPHNQASSHPVSDSLYVKPYGIGKPGIDVPAKPAPKPTSRPRYSKPIHVNQDKDSSPDQHLEPLSQNSRHVQHESNGEIVQQSPFENLRHTGRGDISAEITNSSIDWSVIRDKIPDIPMQGDLQKSSDDKHPKFFPQNMQDAGQQIQMPDKGFSQHVQRPNEDFPQQIQVQNKDITQLPQEPNRDFTRSGHQVHLKPTDILSHDFAQQTEDNSNIDALRTQWHHSHNAADLTSESLHVDQFSSESQHQNQHQGQRQVTPGASEEKARDYGTRHDQQITENHFESWQEQAIREIEMSRSLAGKLEFGQSVQSQQGDSQIRRDTMTEASLQPRILEAYGGRGPYDPMHSEDIFHGAKPNPSATLPPFIDGDPWDIREKPITHFERPEEKVIPLDDATWVFPDYTFNTTPKPGFWERVGRKLSSTVDKAKEKARDIFG